MGDNFRQKARFFAGGHITETPATLTYASIVSRYLARVALTIGAINGIDIFSCNIQNAYLTDEFRENIWTCGGPEFVSEAGTIMIVRMTLYGLKFSGAAFRAHLEETLNGIWYLSTKSEPDIWYRLAVKPNGFE